MLSLRGQFFLRRAVLSSQRTMHILVTNDDGPPSPQSSPYIHSLVTTLHAAGHTVSVVLPHTQRSWIGKAHIVGQAIRPTYYRPGKLQPGTLHNASGHSSSKPLPSSSNEEEWILVDSTPASCVQIGLFHYFQSRGPVDVVISGPNYGRNTTAVFALSSGTLGGALEAAVCGKRSIALSYAFTDRNHDPVVVNAASRMAVRIIERLVADWKKDIHLYSINVPLVKDVETAKVLWTSMLQNAWKSGSCFQEIQVPAEEDFSPEENEQEIRRRESEELERKPDMVDRTYGEGSEELERKPDGAEGSHGETAVDEDAAKHLRYTHKHFKWAPHFRDVYESVEQAPPGNDGWAVKEGHVSVTPLRANFMHVDGFEGELKL